MKDIYHKYNIFFLTVAFLFMINVGLGVFIFINRGCNVHRDMVAFLNIGQGDAIYLQNKAGQSILVDTGNKDSGVIGQIQRVTQCPKVHIDTMILTHPDQDHIGEATNLIQKGYVGQVMHNGFLDLNQKQESGIENDLEKIIQINGIKTQDMVKNPDFDFKNFILTFLYPTTTPYADKKKKTKTVDDNDYSIVLKLIHKNFTFMLTGDVPIKVEKDIIAQYCQKGGDMCPALQSDVLKLGHHGSKNSSGIEFLKAVNAEDYIVSAGAHNKYNHPNEETLYRVYLNKKDSQVRETSKEGNIVYLLD